MSIPATATASVVGGRGDQVGRVSQDATDARADGEEARLKALRIWSWAANAVKQQEGLTTGGGPRASKPDRQTDQQHKKQRQRPAPLDPGLHPGYHHQAAQKRDSP